MAGIDPGGVVDAILSSEELRNGLFRAVTASERCTPLGTRRNETVQEEVSAIFRGNSPAAQTASSQSPVVNNQNNFVRTSRGGTQHWPIFQMRRNYAATGAKR